MKVLVKGGLIGGLVAFIMDEFFMDGSALAQHDDFHFAKRSSGLRGPKK